LSANEPGRRDRLIGWRAAVVWLAAVSGLVAILLAQILNPDSWIVVLTIAGVIAAFGLIGAVVVIRMPANPVGWLLWASGAGLGWATAGVSYATHSGLSCGGCLPGTVPIALMANTGFAPILGAIAIFIPLLFPNGRLPSPRWRPVAWLGLVAIVMFSSVLGLAPGAISGTTVENPIGFTGLGEFAGLYGIVAATTLVVSMILALSSVIWRFRHSDAVERQQLRWFGYAGLAMVVAVVVGLVVPWDSSWVLIFAGLGSIPFATGIAITRYRLYDLDRLVSRTVAYATVTGMLLVVFVGGILVFQAALEPIIGKNGVAVAASTLVVAALFQPLRRRVQARVDHRFNRARYDAQLTATAFGRRLQDEVDLERLGVDIGATVAGAVQPATVSVWLRH
jgi:hypothetical protein